jgi:hypothetical protein
LVDTGAFNRSLASKSILENFLQEYMGQPRLRAPHHGSRSRRCINTTASKGFLWIALTWLRQDQSALQNICCQAARILPEKDKPPRAIIDINDLAALGTFCAAQERDFAIGQDFTIAGPDGLEAGQHTTTDNCFSAGGQYRAVSLWYAKYTD